jgi:hypothetical protein
VGANDYFVVILEPEKPQSALDVFINFFALIDVVALGRVERFRPKPAVSLHHDQQAVKVCLKSWANLIHEDLDLRPAVLFHGGCYLPAVREVNFENQGITALVRTLTHRLS